MNTQATATQSLASPHEHNNKNSGRKRGWYWGENSEEAWLVICAFGEVHSYLVRAAHCIILNILVPQSQWRWLKSCIDINGWTINSVIMANLFCYQLLSKRILVYACQEGASLEHCSWWSQFPKQPFKVYSWGIQPCSWHPQVHSYPLCELTAYNAL